MNKLENCLSGENLDTFKRKKKIWILSSFVSIFLPFVVSLIIGFSSDTFNVLNLFYQGDIIILFYSLTIAILFDLWNTPKNSDKDDTDLKGCFYYLLMVLFFQMSLYGVVKTNGITNIFILIALTIILIISSYLTCSSVLLQIFIYNIKEV